MNKVLFSMLAVALICAASSAKAETGISSQTLNDMGLSGLTVMSDSHALAVRGKGFVGGGSRDGCSLCGPRGGRPATAVFGNSVATIVLPDECPDCIPTGSAHSENGYIAAGPYFSSGTNFSEAGAVISKVEAVDIGGVVTSVTNVTTVRVFAGGSSSARAF
jgi:hypothetical protein